MMGDVGHDVVGRDCRGKPLLWGELVQRGVSLGRFVDHGRRGVLVQGLFGNRVGQAPVLRSHPIEDANRDGFPLRITLNGALYEVGQATFPRSLQVLFPRIRVLEPTAFFDLPRIDVLP